ncbi:plasmid mobilization protein [Chitinophaga eiseniae]|uniref:Mobilization protein n=1 Tax=Chitinophaga eiseniae TaxID=634771 RepID=A0A847S8F0_9BACT|nr:mobilization protein [Chitinophaga eiseniae]NLR78071.1 mobilization protein [Chitinophaga eiseniae]
MGGEKNKVKWCNVRLSLSEHESLTARMRGTTSNSLSEYVRKVLFGGVVVTKVRDQSMDAFMEELIALRLELTAQGNNFNQVVRKLNAIPPSAEYLHWLVISEKHQRDLLIKIEHIQKRISDFSKLWLQE